MQNIYALYFSPTGGTKRIVTALAESLAEELCIPLKEINCTSPDVRRKSFEFSENDLLILGIPTYAGRIPNKILPDLEAGIHGDGNTPAVPISVYGNRNYNESLREMIFLLEENGFLPVTAAACVSRHAFSQTLAKGRPDQEDLKELQSFARKTAAKILSRNFSAVAIDRETPIGPYYTPLKTDGSPARFLKAKPVTDLAKCCKCGICADVCPMGSISTEDYITVTGICIKCQACVKHCPSQAKFFDDEDFLSHVQMLEAAYTARKQNIFLGVE